MNGGLTLWDPSARVVLSVALGLFLGLEREWSQKAAGIRTFALISVLGTVFYIGDEAVCGGATCPPLLSATGAVFTTVMASVLMYSGLREETGLHLTTAVSLLVSYGVGVLVGMGSLLPATLVAVSSSLLLILKSELHGFAWGLSRKELRSTVEFAILAFVVYPLLPAEPTGATLSGAYIEIEPRVVWLMVVFVAGIGLVNYIIVKSYGGRGIAVTGFFGGLASSTAVVGTMLDHVQQHSQAANYGVAAILLANGAMALRNLVITLVFSVSTSTGPLLNAVLPLSLVLVASVVVAAVTADWSEEISLDLETPFSMRNALGFGGLFLLVVLAGSIAEVALGRVGLYLTAGITGLVSSAGATTSAVLLYRAGSIESHVAVIAILVSTLTSIAVKAGLAATSTNTTFRRGALLWSSAILFVGVIGGATVV
jgi:uncharacterized membrane protein (DUF4010 family)